MGSVLIVEDDTDLSALLEGVVAGQGHEVRTAINGRAALDLVSERMPDLILLDVTMPVMDGRQFAAQFRRQHGHAARIVVMTAAESAAMRAREIGADAWLSKPFDIYAVFRVLEQQATASVQ
jgi:DNA-binding response OmpR family regulator